MILITKGWFPQKSATMLYIPTLFTRGNRDEVVSKQFARWVECVYTEERKVGFLYIPFNSLIKILILALEIFHFSEFDGL